MEKYAIDNLRLYAPVDMLKLHAVRFIGMPTRFFAELEENIETNTLALRNQGKENNYFCCGFARFVRL